VVVQPGEKIRYLELTTLLKFLRLKLSFQANCVHIPVMYKIEVKKRVMRGFQDGS
jgi:hypothetical protein